MGRVYIQVEVDLSDIDTEDLVKELQNRGTEVPGNVGDQLQRLWQAFYTGKEDRALQLARELAESATGRFVPQPLRRVA